MIIPHYDDAERLARCLAALTADPDAARFEIIVADNGSSVDPAELVARFPGVRLVVETERGAAAARNRGVAAATAERLLFIDSDCVPEIGWMAAAERALDGADVVGGAVALFDETPPPRSGAEAFETVFAFDQKTYVERRGFSVTANMSTWRRVFDAVGPFRRDVSEDIDWCWRARAMGFGLAYDPDVRVSHPTRSDMPALLRKARRTERELFRLAGGRAARARWALRAVVVLLSPIPQAVRVLRSPLLRSRLERRRALVALARVRVLRAGWMLRQALGLPI